METKLYRKRLIPSENVLLKGDILLERTDDHLVTSWKCIRPRPDFDHGISYYDLPHGWKLSLFYKGNALVYWYCDIVQYEYEASNDSFVFTDLLADVVIYPDGAVRVLDIEELKEAYVNGLLSVDQLTEALDKLGALLKRVYAPTFAERSARLREKLELLAGEGLH